ncbi:hypothetical protein SAMN06295984_1875 [Sphingopyxis terrae subsp. ummariensis]|uniref:Uncharacterized protein n=1 Tax=Sphingopyxis terrae subsp. ummariensis TaxID=429001 RepID=A0A1Y6FQA1_9SPHN|nr:hypothetical protein SAMN06295984_1875 [Sphingopyxis terrae subsp. ummariensis]
MATHVYESQVGGDVRISQRLCGVKVTRLAYSRADLTPYRSVRLTVA